MKKIIALLAALMCFIPTAAHAEETDLNDVITIAAQCAAREDEIDMLARLIYAEARGVKSKAEQAAVAWCVLNRVEHKSFPDTIAKVITQKNQFAYSKKTPLKDEFRELALDVLIRWELEQSGYEDIGRVLPQGYLYFAGRSGRNWFRDKYRASDYWDWEWEDPYE